MGLKITDKRPGSQPPPTMVSRDIGVGEVFEGKIGPTMGIFLRTYDGIVLLSPPVNTWTYLSAQVDDYRPVTAELVITD